MRGTEGAIAGPQALDLKNLLEITFVSSRVFLFPYLHVFCLSLSMKNHPISKMRGPTCRNPILSFNFPPQLHFMDNGNYTVFFIGPLNLRCKVIEGCFFDAYVPSTQIHVLCCLLGTLTYEY